MKKSVLAVVAATLFALNVTTPGLRSVRGCHVQSDTGARQSQLRLGLNTPKRIYHAGEQIHVSAYLENRSVSQTFYVGRELGGFCSILSFHYIELQITDQNNRKIRIANSAGASGWKEGTTQREKIEQEYVPLGPKGIHEQKNACEIRLKKGRYRVRAIYREFEATDWKSSEGLDFPVWTKTLYSNVVTISVIP